MHSGNHHFRLLCLATVALAVIPLLQRPARAVPFIQQVTPRGLQIGATTTIEIRGIDLLPDAHLLMSVPIDGQNVQPGAKSDRLTIGVTLGAEATPGYYLLRVANAKGVSNGVLVGIEDLPQMAFAEKVMSLPMCLFGALSGDQTARTTFRGKKGQRIVVEVEARRLGSAIDPLLELQDARGVPIASSGNKSILSDDPRIDAMLPSDGDYAVIFRDALFRAGNPGQFRLKIGALHYVDFVTPFGVERGRTALSTPIGNVPRQPIRWPVPDRALTELPSPLPKLTGLLARRPVVFVSNAPEVAETAIPRQEISVPGAVTGSIGHAHETDEYRLRVRPGMPLRVEVFANRLGSALDGVLSIHAENGSLLASNDDQVDSIDPAANFTVPQGVETILARVTDSRGQGGSDYLYRLAVTRLDQPDFRLSVTEDRLRIAGSGNAVFRVRANRNSYDGPIQLHFDGLSQQLELSGATIVSGQNDALLSLSAMKAMPTHQLTKLIGEGTSEGHTIRAVALAPESAATRGMSWLRSEIALAVTAPEPIRLVWDGDSRSLPRGAVGRVGVRAERGAGASGPIRLSILTSQTVPRTPDGKQEDRNRALRIEGMPTIPAPQTATALELVVPPDMPDSPVDVVVRAELLDKTGAAVLAEASTDSRRFYVVSPLHIQLTSPPATAARSGSGPTGQVRGILQRAPNLKQPATVSFIGLPKGLPSPTVVVPAEQSEFQLEARFPPGTKIGPLEGVQVVAVSTISPKVTLRSNLVPMALTIVPGEPAAASSNPARLFEDEPAFVDALTEGDGKAVIEKMDRFSGSAAIRVERTQRFRSEIPGWQFKIREKPGPGEYRYIRFAWKKRGGDSIMVQFNAAGKWGPIRGAAGPAYRYESGTAENPYKVAAVRVANVLPIEWTIVERDLFMDFGEFALTGLALTPGPGEFGLFDHIYLAREREDFKACPLPVRPGK